MNLKGKNIGFCLTGSFCTFKKTIEQMKKLVIEEGANVIPIMSKYSYEIDTKFGKAQDFINKIKHITNKEDIIYTIQEAETIGPKNLTDIIIIAPCTRKYNC